MCQERLPKTAANANRTGNLREEGKGQRSTCWGNLGGDEALFMRENRLMDQSIQEKR